jgi:Transglycosylase-like domain
MLRCFSVRSPLFLRAFLTGTSALAVTCFAGAFSIAPAIPAALASYPARVAVNTPPREVPRAVLVSNKVTVQAGETLSGIAAGMCGTAADWTGFYAANRSVLPSPDLIEAGQLLQVNCTDPGYTPSAAPGHTAPGGTYGHPYYCGDGDGDGYDVPCPGSSPAPAHTTYVAVTVPAGGSYSGSGGMQACIISRESGGNSQVVNASGHYGLYQFSYSTWVGSGGNGADFGHASVAEQNQVFANAVAARGYSDWTPYDGC